MKKIQTYDQEIRDGVANLVVATPTLAYCGQATMVSDREIPDKLRKIIAKSNPDQVDLYYLESVLVSTGWNKNDDVFDSSVTWGARHTPEDKQFNFMHNENDIIGHITGSYVIDRTGNKVGADTETPPQDFDIITEAVLYNSWTDPENRDRMKQIIAEIEDGQWFVSMECLFAGFDYALIDSEGKAKQVQRNEESAFLTKHLRAYGGTGEYEGYKVGRSLRDISFSGKGLVSKPANPRSIIFTTSKAFHVEKDDILTKFSIGDVQMSDNSNLLEKQVADLQVELTAAKEENSAMKKNIEEAKDKEFAATIEAFEEASRNEAEAMGRLEETIKSQKAGIAELEDALVQKSEELTKATDTLEGWKQQERKNQRFAALVNAGFDEDEAEESLSLYDALDDEAFEAIVSKWFDKKDKDKKKKDEEKEKDAEATEAVEVDEAEETDETEAEAEVSEEVFENMESSEAALVEADIEGDELQSTRASVAEWISDNVLKSNK
jgi:hypothetical protein